MSEIELGPAAPSTPGPYCALTHSVAVNCVSGQAVAIPFDTEREDTDGMHDPATNPSRVAIVRSGIHMVVFRAEWLAQNTGTRSIYVRLNGTVAPGNIELARDIRNGTSDGTLQVIAFERRFVAGDYIEFIARQTSGADRSVLKTEERSPEATVRWVRS